ncbi:MAG: TonB family protein [Candidatus Margulisiibacteriota bacterium]|jgi:TonB family protein
MDNNSFQRSFVQSFILHGLLVLAILLFPFATVTKQTRYIEFSLQGGGNPAAEGLAGNKTSEKKTEAKKAEPDKKAVAKQVSPAKPPKAVVPVKNTMPVKDITKAKELSNKETKSSATTTINVHSTNKGSEDTGVRGSGIGNDQGMGLGGPIAQRNVVSVIKPEYPQWAAEQGIETDVGLKFWVDPKGAVTKALIMQRSGYVELDLLAKKALTQWVFEPLDPRLEQKEQWGTVTIKYRLE